MASKILVVDDDTDLRGIFRLALEHSGFFVKEASDGLTAIGMVQLEEFDLVILDIAMPRIDGCAALDTFRRMRNGRSVPIVVVTALNEPGLEERVLKHGAVVFLQKPITPVQLVTAVREHLPATTSV